MNFLIQSIYLGPLLSNYSTGKTSTLSSGISNGTQASHLSNTPIFSSRKQRGKNYLKENFISSKNALRLSSSNG